MTSAQALKYKFAADTETWLIVPGNAAPPLVCVSVANEHAEELLDKHRGLEFLQGVLTRADSLLIGANIAFDLAVIANRKSALIPVIFKAYAENRITDVQIREMLLRIAVGEFKFRWDRNTRKMVKTTFRLDDLSQLYLGQALDKGDDGWRLRYGELDGVPLERWPERARKYALTDARSTFDVYEEQGKQWQLTPFEGRGIKEYPVIDEFNQARAAWALSLMRCWGVRTDPEEVAKLKAKCQEQRQATRERLLNAGFLRVRRCQKKDGVLESAEAVPPEWLERLERKYRVDSVNLRAAGRHVEADAALVQANEYLKNRADVLAGIPVRYSKVMEKIRARVAEAFTRLGEPVPMTKPRGNTVRENHVPQVATDSDTLELSGDEDLEFLADSGPVNTLLNTFIPAFEQGTFAPINPGWNVLVSSGRISCREPNFTNLPWKIKGARECIVPRQGHVISSVDYNTQELRNLAQNLLWLVGWSRMADALRAGMDLHLKLAAEMMGITYEEAQRRLAEKDPEVKNYRNLAKPVNFGFPGGMGWRRLPEYARKGYGITIEADCNNPKCPGAKQLREYWLNTFPEMREYFKIMSARTAGGEGVFIQAVSGRPSVCGYTDMCNRSFQGDAADGAKDALFWVSYECYAVPESPLYGCRPILLVHDEICLEGPEATAHLWVARQTEIMRARMQSYTPDIPAMATPALMRRYSKEAEAVFDKEGGKIIPWDPRAKYNSKGVFQGFKQAA